MDIKQILKEKINALFDERKPLVEEFEQYHTYVKYPDITKLNGEIQAYTDCANLIEQSEKPMKPIHSLGKLEDNGDGTSFQKEMNPDEKEPAQEVDWHEEYKKLCDSIQQSQENYIEEVKRLNKQVQSLLWVIGKLQEGEKK